MTKHEPGYLQAPQLKAEDSNAHITMGSPPASATGTPEAKAEKMPLVAVKSAQGKNGLRIKTKRARSQVLILLACLAYIITMFTALSMGLQDISSFLKPRLDNARINLRAQGNLRYREQMLYTQLDKLSDTRLRRGFMETYEECLARGLMEANQQFFGLGFQYPDIRQKTIEWTTDNCGRLLYTPQTSPPTTKQAVLQHWARTTYRARRVVEKTLDIVSSVWVRWSELLGVSPSKAVNGSVETGDIGPTRKSSVTRPEMPFGFALTSEASPCRLTYPKTAGANVDKAIISHDDIIKSVLNVDGLARFCAKVDYLQSITASLALLLIPLEILFLITYSAGGIFLCNLPRSTPTTDNKIVRPSSRANGRFTLEECYAAGSVVLQCLTMLLHGIWGMGMGSDRCDAGHLVLGVVMTGIGLTLLISLFFPTAQVESFLQISKSFKELKTILTSPVDAVTVPEKTMQFNDEAGLEILRDVVSKALREASPSRSKSVSLATTVAEDVRNELEVIREEQNHHAYVESDSDSDFEEMFVDLAGGITPTTEEVEPDVVLVDA